MQGPGEEIANENSHHGRQCRPRLLDVVEEYRR